MSIPRIGPDRDADVLTALFRRASRNLESLIRQNVQKEQIATEAYRRRQHAKVMSILARLRREYPKHLRKMVRRAWDSGVAVGELGQPREDATIGFGGGVNEEAMKRIAREINSNLDDALGRVGRQAADAFREAGLLHSATGIASGEGVAGIKKAIVEDLTHQGLTAFVDKRGARWRLDRYAEMVARTTVREAVSQGTAERIQNGSGPPLITVSSHPHLHDACDSYDGKTFSLPGTTVEGYKAIDRLPPFHPNCKHVISPATVSFELLEKTLEKTLRQESNVRPRTEMTEEPDRPEPEVPEKHVAIFGRPYPRGAKRKRKTEVRFLTEREYESLQEEQRRNKGQFGDENEIFARYGIATVEGGKVRPERIASADDLADALGVRPGSEMGALERVIREEAVRQGILSEEQVDLARRFDRELEMVHPTPSYVQVARWKDSHGGYQDGNLVAIPPLDRPEHFFIALHELGHVKHRHAYTPQGSLKNELEAWEFALERAEAQGVHVDDATLDVIEESLGSYGGSLEDLGLSRPDEAEEEARKRRAARTVR